MATRARKRHQPRPEALRKTLRETFGLSRLRPGQRSVIESIVEGRDTLAVMPTGAGKSLCYQLPALHMPGTTLVVSPLISLIKDQADKLEQAGVSAERVNSSLTLREEAEAIERIEGAESEFVFTTPERLTDPDFIDAMRANRVDLFVIDEAHCISRWGHDFRPAYLQLGAAIRALGRPTVLALTATATAEVIEDIRRQLDLPGLRVINTGVYRPNLHYRVLQVTSETEKLARAIELVRQTGGPGIVYAATVKAVEQVFAALHEAGESVARYHGRMNARDRQENQDAYMDGDRRVMVATNAFGMGIDKRDIRFVMHYQLPPNLEAYYQESGRAGRDGEAACCTLLFFAADKRIQQFFLARRYPDAHEVIAVHEAVRARLRKGGEATLMALAAEAGMPRKKVEVALRLLKDEGLVALGRDRRWRLRKEECDPAAVGALAESYREKAERDRDGLERMVFYAQTGFCRWQVLLEYFGEDEDFDRCGVCDNCRHPPAQRLVPDAIRKTQDAIVVPAPPIFRCGERVRVARYGEGEIIEVAGEKISVMFPDSGRHTFLQSYVERVAK